MERNRDRRDRIEHILAEAWGTRPVPEPSQAWHKEVMQAIRAEPFVPPVVSLVTQVRLAWRAACVAAAAAVVVAVVGYWLLPSEAQLAWQLQRDGIWSQWALQTGE